MVSSELGRRYLYLSAALFVLFLVASSFDLGSRHNLTTLNKFAPITLTLSIFAMSLVSLHLGALAVVAAPRTKWVPLGLADAVAGAVAVAINVAICVVVVASVHVDVAGRV